MQVISEFLRSEFHHPEFEEYRREFGRIVNEPNLIITGRTPCGGPCYFCVAARCGGNYRKIQSGSRWSLRRNDLERIRFFPRAQWRRVAEGSFYLTDMVECLRLKRDESPGRSFFQKLPHLTTRAGRSSEPYSFADWSGCPESPLTILDGNHRMAAAMLAQPPGELDSFQFICGLSPAMTRCCWYRTNVNTVSRYLTNLLRHVFYDPESDIGRFAELDS